MILTCLIPLPPARSIHPYQIFSTQADFRHTLSNIGPWGHADLMMAVLFHCVMNEAKLRGKKISFYFGGEKKENHKIKRP